MNYLGSTVGGGAPQDGGADEGWPNAAIIELCVDFVSFSKLKSHEFSELLKFSFESVSEDVASFLIPCLVCQQCRGS